MARHKPIKQMSAKELKNKIESHMKTTFCYGIATKRLCDAYNKQLFGASKVNRTAAVVMVMATENQTTFAGSGRMYENFEQSGVIDGYTGFGCTPVQFSDKNAEAAPLRVMSFADTYKGTGYKPSRNIVYDPNLDGMDEDDENTEPPAAIPEVPVERSNGKTNLQSSPVKPKASKRKAATTSAKGVSKKRVHFADLKNVRDTPPVPAKKFQHAVTTASKKARRTVSVQQISAKYPKKAMSLNESAECTTNKSTVVTRAKVKDDGQKIANFLLDSAEMQKELLSNDCSFGDSPQPSNAQFTDLVCANENNSEITNKCSFPSPAQSMNFSFSSLEAQLMLNDHDQFIFPS